MSDFSNVGGLKHLYLDDIDLNNKVNESEFLINSAAKVLVKNGGRNWVPVIVKEIDQDRYEVVSNGFIYSVAEAAGLEKIWSIVIEPTPEAEETSQVLAKEIVPKINLTQASRDEIKATLQYLINQPGSPLKTIDLLVATSKLEQADRQYWKNFDPITKLKCGITKGKKLDVLKTAFYLTPLPPPPLSPLPSIEELKQLKVTELRKIAKERGLEGYTKKSKADLLQYFSQQLLADHAANS